MVRGRCGTLPQPTHPNVRVRKLAQAVARRGPSGGEHFLHDRAFDIELPVHDRGLHRLAVLFLQVVSAPVLALFAEQPLRGLVHGARLGQVTLGVRLRRVHVRVRRRVLVPVQLVDLCECAVAVAAPRKLLVEKESLRSVQQRVLPLLWVLGAKDWSGEVQDGQWNTRGGRGKKRTADEALRGPCNECVGKAWGRDERGTGTGADLSRVVPHSW